VEFEWDSQKALINLRRHGTDFADAATALHVVVYTWRDDRPRLISARRATARERRQYDEGVR